jgi:hypothetical protein
MNAAFLPYIAELDNKLLTLLAMPPLTPATLPKLMPMRGVYLLSDGGEHLYVGRSNHIKARLGRHSLPGATYRMAAFAFRLAREATGNRKATYTAGKGSRKHLMTLEPFVSAFTASKGRIRNMQVRFVEETDPVKQALLEVYVAVVLKTRYNDFDNH